MALTKYDRDGSDPLNDCNHLTVRFADKNDNKYIQLEPLIWCENPVDTAKEVVAIMAGYSSMMDMSIQTIIDANPAFTGKSSLPEDPGREVSDQRLVFRLKLAGEDEPRYVAIKQPKFVGDGSDDSLNTLGENIALKILTDLPAGSEFSFLARK
jgi:hypothetical protein